MVLPQYSSFSDFPCLYKWPIRLVLTNSICVFTYNSSLLPYPIQELESSIEYSDFRHAHAYLSQARIKCSTLWRLCPRLLGSLLFISPHKHYPFPWIVLCTRLPQLVQLSCLESDCPADEVVKTHQLGDLHILKISIPVSYLSTSPCPFPPRIWDHRSVS